MVGVSLHVLFIYFDRTWEENKCYCYLHTFQLHYTVLTSVSIPVLSLINLQCVYVCCLWFIPVHELNHCRTELRVTHSISVLPVPESC